ncbi:MAG: DNA-binding transcriptional MocR family regulator [Myxococcota bacterium]
MVRSLGLTLEPGSNVPLYRQIADEITRRIQSGALPAGYRLPPTRTLAAELGAHRNTVVRAYSELTDTGRLQCVVGRGTFVAEPERAPSAPPTPPEGIALPWGAIVSRAASVEPLRRAERMSRKLLVHDCINLTSLQPPPDMRPQEELRRCLDHVLRTKGSRVLGYAPREGVPRLRELLSEDLSRLGVPARTRDIIVTTGSQQALDLIARVLVNPGDKVLVDEATYSGAIHVFAAAGARLEPVPSDNHGPDPRALKRLVDCGAKAFYLMPNCGNPTGRSISLERRRTLVEWSQRSGIPLVEDDYASDLVLNGKAPPPALRALDGQVIYVGTFSKKLIPALRVGFMVIPPGLERHLLPLKHAMDLGTSALLQHALAEFMERGYLKRHLDRIRPLYQERHDALIEALREHMPPEIQWSPPDSGVVCWLSLPDWLDPEEAFQAAQQAGVVVTPGALTSTGSGAGGLRLTYCAEPPRRLAEGARRLGTALSRLIAQRKRGKQPGTQRLEMV